MPEELKHDYTDLIPEAILSAIESIGYETSGRMLALNSYENRVYRCELEGGGAVVGKFYRPDRWSDAAIGEEHRFAFELLEQEIPVVAPLKLQENRTLGRHGKIFFAVFPKKSGRSFDEYNDDQWLELGRLLGRTHCVGAAKLPADRIIMAPHRSTRQQVDYILKTGFIPPDLLAKYQELTEILITEITPLFVGIEMIRIHGDCHFSNLIYRPDESFYIIDFDDMSVGPPVQDFWMLLPGYMEDSLAEINIFLEGYETFRNFDRRTLRLIEPLRAMRYIHYTAWCAHQVAEDGESRVAEDFGSHAYWQAEINDLADQLERIREGKFTR